MWHDLATAIALVLILEGIYPFLDPRGLRRAMLLLARLDDRVVRLVGLASMAIGLVVLYTLH
ncbi:MAG: DUF2065 domain-containing protein [Gammaproteobacteria bacterium]|jgi:uncharacterized protein YjeT (DUF2065 family)